MKDILIVPDVHGRGFWHPALDYPGDVIFLGDYVDPYSFEGISETQALHEFRQIVQFKQDNPERVTLLIGNHELHYYNRQFSAGRYSYDIAPQVTEILKGETTAGLFRICRQIGDFIFIHAGITSDWYERHLKEFQPLGTTLEEQLNNVFKERPFIFYEAGLKYRGGLNNTGSPLWADCHEFDDEAEPFAPDIIQIVGHTQQRGDEPVFTRNIRMLDVRCLFILKDGEVRKYDA
ncbi:MAG: metallophosphoesterase [Bacteroidales bacterium]|jgi:hypothetical protein|nr:metallophosphoesterase [Bacteroidales bacterium]